MSTDLSNCIQYTVVKVCKSLLRKNETIHTCMHAHILLPPGSESEQHEAAKLGEGQKGAMPAQVAHLLVPKHG